MISTTRTGAVIRKELAEIRRNRLIVVTAPSCRSCSWSSPPPVILVIQATATSALLSKRVDYSLFLPLLVPVLIPATMSAYSVVGERSRARSSRC